MRGVVILGERTVDLWEFPDPVPGPGEVVVAIQASGLCGSDLRPYRGPRRDPASLVTSPVGWWWRGGQASATVRSGWASG